MLVTRNSLIAYARSNAADLKKRNPEDADKILKFCYIVYPDINQETQQIQGIVGNKGIVANMRKDRNDESQGIYSLDIAIDTITNDSFVLTNVCIKQDPLQNLVKIEEVNYLLLFEATNYEALKQIWHHGLSKDQQYALVEVPSTTNQILERLVKPQYLH